MPQCVFVDKTKWNRGPADEEHLKGFIRNFPAAYNVFEGTPPGCTMMLPRGYRGTRTARSQLAPHDGDGPGRA